MDPPKCYIICSHSNRIVDLLKEYGVKYKDLTKRDKPNNCAILEFRFNSEKKVIGITEIYEGDSSTTLSNTQLFPTKGNPAPNDTRENTRIFVIRHGEGIHNPRLGQVLAKLSSSYTDPELTPNGIEQSKAAGTAFAKYLTTHTDVKIDDLFVSNLQRSYYTLYYFLYVQFEANTSELAKRLKIRDHGPELDTFQYSANFIVLPNSEEVSKSLLKGHENESKCTNNSKDADSKRR